MPEISFCLAFGDFFQTKLFTQGWHHFGNAAKRSRRE